MEADAAVWNEGDITDSETLTKDHIGQRILSPDIVMLRDKAHVKKVIFVTTFTSSKSPF